MSQQTDNAAAAAATTVAPQATTTNPPATPKKRKSTDDTDANQPAGDHRKRRRNRTTQSCLNCHGSKRMCDRKRPACGRCVKLGLSGICVYEVDDLNQRDTEKDETAHLKSRIAELEGFIREFKKKPHPRWAAELLKSPTLSASTSLPGSGEDDRTRRDSFSASDASSMSTPSRTRSLSSSASTSSVPPTPRDQHDVPILLTSPHGEVPSFLFTSHADKQAPFLSMTASTDETDDFDAFLNASGVNLREGEGTNPGPEDDLERVFAQILQCDAKRPPTLHIPTQHSHASSSNTVQKCHCVRKSSAYSVVLELAPHIRRALDALSALPEHCDSPLNEACDYFKQLQGLDAATSALVESVSSCLIPNSSSAAYATPMSSPLNNNFPSSSTASFDYLSKHAWPSASDRIPGGANCTNGNGDGSKTSYANSGFLTLPSQGASSGNLWLGDSAGTEYHGASPDRFMSWEPSPSPGTGMHSTPDWPRTIAL